jgi:hypothetical protein
VKRPFGELAPLGEPRPGSQNRVEHGVGRSDAAVAADFHDVFASVGSRCPAGAYQHLIDNALADDDVP